jgi:hypothetical protein
MFGYNTYNPYGYGYNYYGGVRARHRYWRSSGYYNRGGYNILGRDPRAGYVPTYPYYTTRPVSFW